VAVIALSSAPSTLTRGRPMLRCHRPAT
jgi:hypothetical protein